MKKKDNRIGEEGFLGRLKMFLSKAYCRSRSFTRQMIGHIGWIMPAFRFLLHSVIRSEKRILAIWDFRTVPYSIGDLIIFHERINILRLTHKVDKVDICFVYEPDKPARKAGLQGVTPDNFHYHFPPLVSTVYLTPHIGSFFLFDSHRHLEEFVADNAGKYYVWPGIKDYINKYKSYRDNFDFVQDFYRKNGFIPYIDCRAGTLEWAYTFYKKHVLPDYPVVVHLRNNPRSGAERNACLDAWLKFFKFCEGKFDVKFIMIGSTKEIDNRFRNLPNVLISKDYATTVEKDAVLAYSSLIDLGISSGLSAMVYFSQTPYIMFNYRLAHENLPHGENFPFATELQKLVWIPETTEILIEEFSKLFPRVSKTDWREKMDKFMASRGGETFQSHLLWSE